MRLETKTSLQNYIAMLIEYNSATEITVVSSGMSPYVKPTLHKWRCGRIMINALIQQHRGWPPLYENHSV